MELIRFKQHRYETTRNGKTVEDWNEYQIIAKPTTFQLVIEGQLNDWLDGGNYEWDDYDKKNIGTLPDDYSCWCEAIGDFLIEKGFEPVMSDSWDNAEIWKRNQSTRKES